MPALSKVVAPVPERLEQVRQVSGRLIEERRKHSHITQRQLSISTGIGVRWLREIEAGNPCSTFDNHLRCAFALGLGASHLFVPLLFMEHEVKFPLALLLDDPGDLDEHCIASIGDYYVASVARQLRPGPAIARSPVIDLEGP
ncbi:transcriptional regulator [Novosphingobium resinovorum]|uniref:Transcriptional regulator n=1 Tax=Novosphingobium resinovorum TaxID=158500 RepID=A0A1D8AFM7_9SPHN|nr:transcriptional regulator [Novosphingobium resinovorum]AOR80899.1 transcriptional regulator [Novosphingobium resinovorum]